MKKKDHEEGKEPAKKVILLVDDDARVVETVGDWLRFEGFQVIPAYTAEEGLRVFKRRKLDLIILDIGMPGMNGITFLNQVSAEAASSVPILVFTARANPEQYRQHPAVRAVLSKTSAPTQLIAEVRRLLEQSGGANVEGKTT